MTTPHERLATALRRAEVRCLRDGWSFPDMLREALQEVAVGLGGSEELVRTRPGSWEADHLRQLAAAADWTIDETAHVAAAAAAHVTDAAASPAGRAPVLDLGHLSVAETSRRWLP